MQCLSRILLSSAVAISALGGTFGSVFAQAWPTAKNVTIVVPFAAGGTTDLIARLIGDKLSQRTGQKFLIENKAGAGGNTGVSSVAKAAPDGYTLTMGTVSTHSINPNVYSKMPFDHIKDFAPVSLLASVPNILMVNIDFPAKTVPELIAVLKKEPGKYSFGSSGAGTSTHMAAELFKVMSGTDMIHVPYRSSAQVTQDLMAGHIKVTFDNITVAWPLVQDGKIRALATATEKRLDVDKNLPTVGEFLPGFAAASWHGLFAPAGTPKEIVDKLSTEIQAIMKDPGIVETLNKVGVTPIGSDPATFVAHIAAETARWKSVAEKANVKIE